MKILALLALLIIPTMAVAEDGVPYTTHIGQHYFTLYDPVAGDGSITFVGYERDLDARGVIGFTPGLQRCYSPHQSCIHGQGVWLDVRFGPWVETGVQQWSFEWFCTPTRGKRDYRQMLILRMRDHSIRSVLPEGEQDILSVRCA